MIPSPQPRGLARLVQPDFSLPFLVVIVILVLWEIAVRHSRNDLFPGPWQVALGIVELARKGLLFKYVVASLFRVTWGFSLAVLVGVPLGLFLGWFRPAYQAFNPLIQILRPISPIAWIPLAILWFGVSDAAPVFLIFLASVFPITVSSTDAVRNLEPVYIRAARNFELGRIQLFSRVILPGSLPRIITGIRIALGVAWLVVVAAELAFRQPARFDDELMVNVSIEPPGRSSLNSHYRIDRNGQLIAEATLTHVCVDAASFEKQPWPGWFRDQLASASETQ